MHTEKINLLINLPPGFFETRALEPVFARLAERAELRRRSHNNPEEIQDDLHWADAVIMWCWPTLSRDMLEQAAPLRFIGHLNGDRATAEAELALDIPVSEARHGWSPAVSEMALTHILCGLRRLCSHNAAMHAGSEHWVARIPADVDPRERQLTGRPVGIVGFGAIGQRLAELLKPFKCDICIHDPFLPDEVAAVHQTSKVTMMELVQRSDVIVLCAAVNAESQHLMGRAEIAAMRRDALLVNVGRAHLVDMNALRERVEKGEVLASLDVFEQEPMEPDNPWRKVEDAYLTPHRAGGIQESAVRILTMLVDDLEATLDGHERKYPLTERMMNCI